MGDQTVLRSTVVRLDIQGLGILLYSPFAAAGIRTGEDYFSAHYANAQQVVPQILAGALVGFGTGSPGTFTLEFSPGYPTEAELQAREFKLRLALEVRDGLLCARDLYDLLDWNPTCLEEQTIELPNGYYHVTLCSSMPPSGVLGDDQVIQVYLNALPQLPALKYDGVPTLCT